MELSKYISEFNKYIKTNPKPTLKIALLSTFTIKGLKEVISLEASKSRIDIEVYTGAYGQIIQEFLNEDSNLISFSPDITFIVWDRDTLFGDYVIEPYEMNVMERRNFIDNKLKEINNYIEIFLNKIKGTIVINNLEIPSYSPLGILENKQEFGLYESVRYINSEIDKLARIKNNLYIYDYDTFLNKYGKNHIVDNKMYYLADMKLSMEMIVNLGKEYTTYIFAMKGKTKKCLVLDLDNTLWGGIVGEKGITGIKLSPNYEGKAYYEFQKYIQALSNRGVILAINSKNNYEDAMNVIRNHKYMILRENSFASVRINWQDKATNIMEIAKELNIGLDSIVFIDDDRVNCDLVNKMLPMVKTICLDGNPANYVNLMKNLQCFNQLIYTAEDRNKTKQYQSQKARNDLKEKIGSIEEYIKSLEIKVNFYRLSEENINRISQLTLKTNQFNLTNKRYQTEELIELQDNKKAVIECINVEDKFGDNGISGVIIYYVLNENVVIDTMLLSCRVMGRNIEKEYFLRLEEYCRSNGLHKIIGKYVRSDKNKPVEKLYERYGFKELEQKDNYIIYEKQI